MCSITMAWLSPSCSNILAYWRGVEAFFHKVTSIVLLSYIWSLSQLQVVWLQNNINLIVIALHAHEVLKSKFIVTNNVG